MSKEIWCPVQDFEGEYLISSHGKIKSIERTIIRSNNRVQFVPSIIRKCWVAPNGYANINLSKQGNIKIRSIHTLVLEAFVGPRPENCVANHKDGNKLNNNIDNLEWITQSENVNHAKNVLNKTWGQKGELNSQAKLSNKDINYIIKNPDELGVVALARKFCVSHSLISMIKSKKRWKHL